MLVLREQREKLVNGYTSYIIDYSCSGSEPIFLINWEIVMIRSDMTEFDRFLFLDYFKKYKTRNDILRCTTENQTKKLLTSFKNRTREELLKHFYDSYSPRYVFNLLNMYDWE